ncbi:allantoinase AllB [Paenibacillus rhizoplanae]
MKEEGYELIIRNGQVVLPGEVRRLEIGVKDGKIAALGEALQASTGTRILDAEGQYVLPGMIDMHVHFNEPAFGHWEGFRSGSAALAAGGCTCYADMPLNGNPPTVNLEALRLKAEAAAGNSAVDYVLWGGLVPGNLEELEGLAAAGVTGFKAFISNPGGEGEGRFREVDDDTLYQGDASDRCNRRDTRPACGERSDNLGAGGRRHYVPGAAARGIFAASRPPQAELEAVARALLYSERTGCKLHFVHISTAAALELIHEAKLRGLDVTAETCPHYLILDEDSMETLGALAKCAPPLRSSSERDRLWAALAAGRVDLVASDHSPCPPELKLAPGLSFMEAWGGISGAQSSLELMFHEGVHVRGLPVTQISALISGLPARRFGLEGRKGSITPGLDADLVLLDPDAAYTLRAEDLLYRHRHSPYVGMTLSCKVTATICRGNVVYTAAEGVIAGGGGEWLRIRHSQPGL